MSVPACLQSFCIFGLKCSVVNPEVGMERSGSRQPVVVFLPGGGKKKGTAILQRALKSLSSTGYICPILCFQSNSSVACRKLFHCFMLLWRVV